MACAKWLVATRGVRTLEDFLAVSFIRAARALAPVLIAASMAGGPGRAAESSSAAQDIYASAPPRLLQIRSLVAGAGRQASIGSGFLVSADGLAVTNYHVVSQAVLEPQNYRLEYSAADGSHGDLRVLGVDLPNDLAVVRLDKHDAPFFSFDPAAISGNLAKGERLYSMGNPLDLGFTIMEGTYNGLVERSYTDQILFAAALNPGMSGGPTVTARGSVVGVNVATRRGGQLISFLVPARFAAALVERVRDHEPPSDLRAEVARQLTASRTDLYKAFAEKGFRSDMIGLTGRRERARPGSIAGRTPMPERFPSRAPVSTPPDAPVRPACSSPPICTPAGSRSAIPTSDLWTSISSSWPRS
jgi:serine protease Do